MIHNYAIVDDEEEEEEERKNHFSFSVVICEMDFIVLPI